MIYCIKCGAQLPDDAKFCLKCGASLAPQSTQSIGQTISTQAQGTQNNNSVIAPSGVASLKCPNCGAPIAPKFGEMVITCAYCGSGVTLGSGGWRSIQRQTMLPLKLQLKDDVVAKLHSLMDHGLPHLH